MLTILKQRLNRYIARNRMLHSQEVKSVYYFAYGANLSPDFFRSRIPDFEFIGLAMLSGYKLEFNLPCEYCNKGFAGITPSSGDSVFGALYKITPSSLHFLDWAEWLPFNFYRRERLGIQIYGSKIPAEVYIQQNPRMNLYPSNGYKNLILNSLKQMNAPAPYIEMISKIEGRDSFTLDHSFNLNNPALPRFLPAVFYVWHDKLREILCKYI